MRPFAKGYSQRLILAEPYVVNRPPWLTQPPNWYPASSVTADPRGGRVLVTMEASDVVVGVELGPFRGERQSSGSSEGIGTSGFFDTGRFGGELVPSMSTKAAGMTNRALVAQHTGAGPRGIAFTEAALVASYVDWSRPVDVGGDDKDDVIERGRAIFERPDVGCT